MNRYRKALATARAELAEIKHAGGETIAAVLEGLDIAHRRDKRVADEFLLSLRRFEWISGILAGGFVLLFLLAIVLWLAEEYRNISYISGLIGVIKGVAYFAIHKRIKDLSDRLSSSASKSIDLYSLLIVSEACQSIVDPDRRDKAYERLVSDIIRSRRDRAI